MELEQRAAKAAGNHRAFQSFGWHERPDNDEEWTIVYTSNRDADLVTQANAAAIAEMMSEHIGEDCREESHGHWAVGHVDGYAIRVFRNGQITDAFRKWCEIQDSLEEYPILDDEKHSELEHEAALEGISLAGKRMVRDDAPETWPSEVFSWFWDNNQGALEHDGQGAYPSEDDMTEALEALGYLASEDE
jgi:hypothetical protein